MQIVIDIPENDYNHIKKYYEKNEIVEATYSYIYHGTPLPKGHGRLIDADKVLEQMRNTFDMQELYLPIHLKELVIDEMPTIIEADMRGGEN